MNCVGLPELGAPGDAGEANRREEEEAEELSAHSAVHQPTTGEILLVSRIAAAAEMGSRASPASRLGG